MSIEEAKRKILSKYIHQLYLKKPNKAAIMRLIEESYQLGLNYGWQFELDQSIELKDKS